MKLKVQLIRAGQQLRTVFRDPAGSGASGREEFYPSSPTCQIPNLSFILERFLGRRTNGLFVEVGAFDGVFVSNSWGLASRGWHGLMMEPVRDAWRACKHSHRNHPAVTVLQTAVGPPGVESIQLHKAGALTTANDSLAREYADVSWSRSHLTKVSETVPCSTLDELLEAQSVPRGFEVLIVDVEGYEEPVFRGFDLSTWRPLMMVIELADMHPDLASTMAADATLMRHIQDAGYQVVFKDQVNTVFVRIDLWKAIMLPQFA